MAIPPVTRLQIIAALHRFDGELRNSLTWSGWEQDGRHKYAILFNRRRYPVKQVVAIATGLRASDFRGGEGAQQANQFVRARRFWVVELSQRSPPWKRDELILALDLYLRFRSSLPPKRSQPVRELSRTLNQLAAHLRWVGHSKFRNPNGVYMKLMNFRALDPDYTLTGKVGLQKGGKKEKVVWNDFASDPDKCRRVAQKIRRSLEVEASDLFSEGEEDFEAEAEEGRFITEMHRRRERRPDLIRKRKQQFLIRHGRVFCEVCEFDFEKEYGERGRGFIEVHHTTPVSDLQPGDKTRVSDLALLCANCHRMIHARRPWLTLVQLREMLRGI